MPTPIKATITDVTTDYFGHVLVKFDIAETTGALLNRFQVALPHRGYTETQALDLIKTTLRELQEHREDEENPALAVAAIRTALVGQEVALP